MFLIDSVRCWFSAGHNLRGTGPGRTPPDPDMFPNYIQNRTGLWLHWRYWGPTTGAAPKGIILACHGLDEHHGRYEGLAAYFNAKGYGMYMCESQGHGSSDGMRKYAEDFNDLVDDQRQFLTTIVQPAVKAQHGAVPLFLFGHSMGGLISAHLSAQRPDAFRAVLLSGAALKIDPSVAPEWLKSISSFLSTWFPKLFVVPVLDPTELSHDPQVVAVYSQDHLVSSSLGLRARFGCGFLNAVEKIPSLATTYKCPVLIMHGTLDKISMPEGAKEFHDTIKSTDKQLNMYEGLFHEILNERKEDRAKVRSDMLHFMDARL